MDPRTDVFSFGIVFYEMLAGRRPIDAETLPDLLDGLVRKDAPTLSAFIPEIPLEVETIATRALARDRDDRYQSFEPVLADLSAVKRRLDAGEKLELASGRTSSATGTRETDHRSGEASAAAPSQTSTRLGAAAGAVTSTRAGVRAWPGALRYYLTIGLFITLGAASYLALQSRWPFQKKSPSASVEIPAVYVKPPKAKQPRGIRTDNLSSITAVAVSGDRKFFAYAQQNEISIWWMPPRAMKEMLTADANGYYGSSLTADSRTVVMYRQGIAHLYVAKEKGNKQPGEIPLRLLTSCGDTGLSWTPEGEIIFNAGPAERKLLYEIVLADPNHPWRLTIDPSDTASPSVTPDGKYVVFASDRNGKPAVWRANLDGSDGSDMQLAGDGMKPSCLLEHKWVVYQVANGDNNSLWKVSIEGGQPERVTDPEVNAQNPAVSPDGESIAFLLTDPAQSSEARPQIAIIKNGKQLPVRYNVSDNVHQPIIRWRDDATLVYVDESGKGVKIWQQPLARGMGKAPQPKPLRFRDAQFRCIFNFDWSASQGIVVSAEAHPDADVYEMTLTPQS